MKLQHLKEIICVKSEPPETTPLLSKIILDANAARTVQEYLFTPSLRAHFQMVFECAVHRKGQGFLGSGGVRCRENPFPGHAGQPSHVAQ
jgi:hypothetical protein